MIRLVIPSLPPSVNHAYFTRGRKRIMTKVGKAYQNETEAYLQRHYPQEMMIFKPNHRYQFYFLFHVESVRNKLWKPGGKVSKYKKFDGGNLCKLLEDCIASAGGIDDSQTMRSTWEKKDGDPERTEVWAWDLDHEHDPFDYDFLLQHLR